MSVWIPPATSTILRAADCLEMILGPDVSAMLLS
jgi:hypothetical protein